jgi:hypothetical protein
MAGIAANLAGLASVAGLDYSHEVGVVALLLGLAAAGSRLGDIAAISGHDAHAREMREVGCARS